MESQHNDYFSWGSCHHLSDSFRSKSQVCCYIRKELTNWKPGRPPCSQQNCLWEIWGQSRCLPCKHVHFSRWRYQINNGFNHLLSELALHSATTTFFPTSLACPLASHVWLSPGFFPASLFRKWFLRLFSPYDNPAPFFPAIRLVTALDLYCFHADFPYIWCASLCSACISTGCVLTLFLAPFESQRAFFGEHWFICIFPLSAMTLPMLGAFHLTVWWCLGRILGS